MIDEYGLKMLIDSFGLNTIYANELIKNNILTQLLFNTNEEQKARITEHLVNSICSQYKNNNINFDIEIIKSLINSDIIENSILALSDEIKGMVEFKLEKIFKELNTNYDDLFRHLKNEIIPYIKKYVQNTLAGKNEVIDESLRIVTIAFSKLSLQDHAEKLFNKAQSIINAEIIKDIIE